VALLPDPVLGLEPADDARFARALEREGIPRAGRRPRLALALRDLSFMGFGRELVLETLRRLAPECELLFVPQCTDHDCDDRLEAEALARELPGAVVHQVRARHAPDVLMRFYETAAATLAVRLHGAVFSAMAGTPVVGLAYLPKVRGFLERAGELQDIQVRQLERILSTCDRVAVTPDPGQLTSQVQCSPGSRGILGRPQ